MSRRLPHIGHALLFLALLASSFLLAGILLMVASGMLHGGRAQLAASVLPLAYALTLLAARRIFPMVWPASFAQGIRWNAAAARPWLLAFGLALGLLSQSISMLIPTPRDVPIETLLRNPSTIWLLAVFGVLLAPLLEEILFRGFLLPAFATAVDYARLPRVPGALKQWRLSTGNSRPALVVSTLLTSLLFALIHAPQLDYTWPAVLLLFCVSIVLCAVRLHTRSVAASALVHATYNLSIFLSLFLTTHAFRHLQNV